MYTPMWERMVPNYPDVDPRDAQLLETVEGVVRRARPRATEVKVRDEAVLLILRRGGWPSQRVAVGV